MTDYRNMPVLRLHSAWRRATAMIAQCRNHADRLKAVLIGLIIMAMVAAPLFPASCSSIIFRASLHITLTVPPNPNPVQADSGGDHQGYCVESAGDMILVIAD